VLNSKIGALVIIGTVDVYIVPMVIWCCQVFI